ncbi:aminotransferase class V-fold PLP-dependent enzyme [Desulfuromonas sp. CSMB_57]|uniref:aminotransferase class V-fold PLP-dependent enzyme n=1 Tax=Desulfuromonas sp. CSMB_57 TaxID=2807629 RepID=UPI001CD3A8E3|nr:aminotransferase class V-fold PLP-dependent enzyme [Desulfuromonas sp. CSMB_57]
MADIYLDNAATSFPKAPGVSRAVAEVIDHLGTSPGRGSYRLALQAGRLLFDIRETVADFFGIADASRVVFTSGATEALNLALFGLLQPGDRVITSSMEHNAVLRPLHALQQRGIEVVRVPADASGLVAAHDIRAAATQGTKRTRMVALTHAANVTGTIQPIEELGPWCRAEGILLLVDAAQSAGLLPIDVEAQGIDLLAVPGHKNLLGPAGTGFLYVREGLQPRPLNFGGTGGDSTSPLPPEELPERLESGTVNLPGLAGLRAGLLYLQSRGLQAVRRHKAALLEQVLSGLKRLDGVRIYGPGEAACHAGVVSINLAGRDPAEIGYRLDADFGICVRTGLHCAPEAHRTIGSFPDGTVRISPGLFNTSADIDTLLQALHVLAKG